MRNHLPYAWLANRGRLRSVADDPMLRWVGDIGLAAAVGAAYFLVAHNSVGLVLESTGVAVFWPAAGITSGSLIALGSRARLPLAAGVIGASIAVHYAEPLWAGIGQGISNAAEALVIAGLIQHYFGSDFTLDRLSQVLGLLAAAIVGTAVSGLGGAATLRLLQGPSADMLVTWQHWFASDIVGIVAVAPLVIGLAAALKHPPPRSEVEQSGIALVALAAMTVVIL